MQSPAGRSPAGAQCPGDRIYHLGTEHRGTWRKDTRKEPLSADSSDTWFHFCLLVFTGTPGEPFRLTKCSVERSRAKNPISEEFLHLAYRFCSYLQDNLKPVPSPPDVWADFFMLPAIFHVSSLSDRTPSLAPRHANLCRHHFARIRLQAACEKCLNTFLVALLVGTTAGRSTWNEYQVRTDRRTDD